MFFLFILIVGVIVLGVHVAQSAAIDIHNSNNSNTKQAIAARTRRLQKDRAFKKADFSSSTDKERWGIFLKEDVPAILSKRWRTDDSRYYELAENIYPFSMMESVTVTQTHVTIHLTESKGWSKDLRIPFPYNAGEDPTSTLTSAGVRVLDRR